MPSTTCGWCGRYSNMALTSEPEMVLNQFQDFAVVYATYRCDYCGRWNLARYEGQPPTGRDLADWMHDFDSFLKWLPKVAAGKAYDDVPSHIAAAAKEAHECASVHAYRAAVQLTRSVVEATAKDKGYTSGTLMAKIDAMYNAGLFREHIREAAHEIRYLGNDMAHGDFVPPVAQEEADEILELMAEVLHEVYQSPARVARRREARLVKEHDDSGRADGLPC